MTPELPSSGRDGTSQAGRILPELDPGYARVDERTTRDLLAFAHEYSRELKYFGPDNPQDTGDDWSGFIGRDDDLDTAAAYARDPEKLPAGKAARYARPHFALFLAFLELLGEARERINGFTHRHLEFFYRDVLQMFRKRAVPDTVHVLVDLEPGTRELRLPAGTALDAGKDSAGTDLVYRTERVLAANRVQVAQASSLRAETQVTGIKEAGPQYRTTGKVEDAFVAMLKMALGRPAPGGRFALPKYEGAPTVPATPPGAEAGFAALEQILKLVMVVERGLGMPLFDDFRELMRLKALRRKEKEDAEWQRINEVLKVTTQEPANFKANLEQALGKKLDGLFDGLAEVENVDQAYALYRAQPDDPDVVKFLTRVLTPVSLKEFDALMAIKTSIDSDWEGINQLLESAARRKAPGWKWSKKPNDMRASHDFGAKLRDAGLTLGLGAGDFTFGGDIDKYDEALRAVERAFYMSAENFKYILSNAPRGGDAQASGWDGAEKTYRILAAAHRRMIYRGRADTLEQAASAALAALGKTPKLKALRDMLAVVFGDPDIARDETSQKLDAALQALGELGVAPGDAAALDDIRNDRVAEPDWPRVAEALEVAQRNREGLKEPVAEKVEWRNLYPAADAQQVRAVSATPEAGAPRWKTFGRGEQARAKEPAPAASFGWAMSSPLLALGEGKRTVELSLGFAAGAEPFDIVKQKPFQVEISTAKGWLAPQSVKLEWTPSKLTYARAKDLPGEALPTLLVTLVFAEGEPALAPLSHKVHGIDTPAPVLRVMVKPEWDEDRKCYVTASYRTLRELTLLRAKLVVHVEGLARLSIASDQGTLDASKPFEPFGAAPAVGSRFYFGHPEIVGRRLDALKFNITWMAAPEKFAVHYANYPDKPADNAALKVNVALAEFGVLKAFPALQLFNKDDARAPVVKAELKLPPDLDQGNPARAVSAAADVTAWNRYFLWELTPEDFRHPAYASAALAKSLALAAEMVKEKPAPKPEDFQVNPPYTPKIKSLTLDYRASGDLTLDAASVPDGAVRAFHVEPFGYAELKPGATPGCRFLPRYEFAGELYIGLRGVAAPQNVSLLFQVAEGSANPDLAPDPVQWSFLSGNEWLPMDDESLLADDTRGFINAGIVELALKPAAPSTRLLPADLYWIRAAIAHNPDCVCDLIAIHPNAVPARFTDQGNAPDHLKAPLAPERIKQPVTPVPGVAGVRQPYPSFGGKMAEQDESFYVRVSERLRHKERALAAWDYERLVLEKFPQLYKAKCLRAGGAGPAQVPGTIALVVIPDIKNRLPFNPFEPKAPAALIRDIEAFLRDKVPPFARVEVKNARYVPVRVRCGVRFRPGEDESFCRLRLNDELNRFLSPWAYDEGADIVIGGSVYANSIINFIDSRDYVDYIAGFKLFRIEDGKVVFIDPPQDGSAYYVGTRAPDGVLVADLEHQFDVITEADHRLERIAGIDYLRVELDFRISETDARAVRFGGVEYMKVELDFKVS